jgi:TolA-binding protein
VSYRDDSREKFSRVEVRGDGSGIVDFQYGNDRLRTARFTPDSSEQYEWLQLSMSHGDEYSNGAVFSVSTGQDTGPTELGTFDWSVEEDQISSLTAQFNIPLNGDSASMTLAAESISWLQDPEPVVLADTSGMTRLSRNELGQKFMPIMMMAVSGMNQTAGDTAPGSGESEEEMTASTEPAETEAEPAPSKTEETPSEQATRPSEPSDEEPEPEPSPEPSEPDQPSPSAESDGGVESPADSGETIRYSSIGRFPMSEPPAAYEEAREAYGNGDFTTAQEVLAPLVEKYPNSANANYLMGMIHFEQGNFEEARPYFEKAAELEHDPQIKVWSEQFLDRIDNRTSS